MSELAQTATKERSATMNRWYRLLVERRDVTLLITIVIISFVFSRLSPYYLTIMNMRTVALAVAFNAIVAIGVTILIIGGYNDISVGATYGLSSIVVAMLISEGFPTWPGIGIGLLIAVGIGWINGTLITRFHLPPFLATLGTMSVFRGLIWVVSGAHSIVGVPQEYKVLGQTKILGVQLPVYIMLVIVVVADFLLRRSTFLRQMFYIGVNKESAEAAGIPVARVTTICYIISALLAAVGGILDGARLGAVYIQAGLGIEFQVITASVLGGTALSGGRGTIFGAFLGVVVMSMLTNFFNLVGVSMYWQAVLVGAILLLVVALDRVVTPKEAR